MNQKNKNISKVNRHYTPDQIHKNRKIGDIQQMNKPKNIINKNQNIYNIHLTPNSIKNSPNNNLINIDKNEINLLNQKIVSQKNNISYLKTRLGNYENTKKEISRLNKELEKMEEAIKGKNAIISEFQKLSEITKKKFETYLKSTDSQMNLYNKKYNNFPELEKENKELSQKLILVQNENITLKQKYNEIESKYKIEIDTIQNDISNLKRNYEEIIKENDILRDDNINSVREIQNLRKQLSVQEKYEEELEQIKKKYFFLETKINQKENNINNLQKINDVLEKKIISSDESYKKILNQQSNLNEKLKQLEYVCKQYEFFFRKVKIHNNIPPDDYINENNIINNYILYNPDSYKNRKIINKRNRNRVIYNHNNARKIIGTEDNLKSNYNFNYNKYDRTYNCDNCHNLNENIRLNNYTQNDNQFNLSYSSKRNREKINNIKDYNIIKNNNEILDKSFGYSNYLLDNLKNKISEIHFDGKY